MSEGSKQLENKPLSISLMDPNQFAVISPDQVRSTVRLHHVGVFFRFFQEWPEYQLGHKFAHKPAEFLSEMSVLDKKLPHADTEFTVEERTAMAKAIAEIVTKDRLKNLQAGNKSNEAEYIGDQGKRAQAYQQELEHYMLEVFTHPADAKIRLNFKPDKICQIAQGGRGPVAHCASSGVAKDDLLYWYAINQEAVGYVKTKSPYSKQIGLIETDPNRYDIWITVSLVRNFDFLGAVFENFLSLAH
ncbi:MAG: hypothetical protein UV59_C0012G0046 [Candidatus Gottesmanbacteria bacterium GW2011_GWA1_43_11]|uniref:Uncharacterized protein n=1 Tax=Candidatus Gottesmanbacteria bacterium GW2011_GWA1_43_11 TaxID=1618436 RepID=A0A0G1FDM1_9BACT|nr:MAG: hypothetical protein UV59_C0012G0046 [Candidatus Gottesmanbacteria bacterium GW2011_GWA1_43_11]